MFNAVRFLGDYEVPHWFDSKHATAGWVSVRCPLCHDHSDHGGFNVEGFYNCWRCGVSSVPWVICNLIGVSYDEAKRIREDYDSVGASLVPLSKSKERATKVEVPGDRLDVQHKRYLERRGFNVEYIEEKYEVRGTQRWGRLAHRIVIPIKFNERVVCWTARSLFDEVESKYLASSDHESILSTKEVLYNLDNCKKRRVVIVEGPFDVWKIGDDCCAVLGLTFNWNQIGMLIDRFDEFYVMFDSGANESGKAEWLASILESSDKYKTATVIQLESGDPADLSMSEVDEIRRKLEL